MKVISDDSRGWASKSFPPNITGQNTKAFFIHCAGRMSLSKLV